MRQLSQFISLNQGLVKISNLFREAICPFVCFVCVLMIVNIETQNYVGTVTEDHSATNLFCLCHTPYEGLRTMMEEDSERLFRTEVDRVQSKPCFLVMTRPTALRNSQQSWVSAQARARQHSSVDLGRSSQLLHKSLFIFSPSLPSHT